MEDLKAEAETLRQNITKLLSQIVSLILNTCLGDEFELEKKHFLG